MSTTFAYPHPAPQQLPQVRGCDHRGRPQLLVSLRIAPWGSVTVTTACAGCGGVHRVCNAFHVRLVEGLPQRPAKVHAEDRTIPTGRIGVCDVANPRNPSTTDGPSVSVTINGEPVDVSSIDVVLETADAGRLSDDQTNAMLRQAMGSRAARRTAAHAGNGQ